MLAVMADPAGDEAAAVAVAAGMRLLVHYFPHMCRCSCYALVGQRPKPSATHRYQSQHTLVSFDRLAPVPELHKRARDRQGVPREDCSSMLASLDR